MTHQTKAAPAELPEPTANFALNKGWGTWEEVIDSAAGDPDVVAMYTADQMRTVIAPLIAERDALAAKLAVSAANTLDAERYRKLRAQTWDSSDLFVVAGGRDRVKLGTNCPSLGLLDAAVDALPAIVKEHE